MINDLFDDVDFPNLFPAEPIIPNLTSAEDDLIKLLPSELKAINDRIEHLELALNTQSLRIEVERAKWQKLRVTMKQRRYEIPTLCPEALKQLVDANFVQQDAVNFQLGGDIDRLNTLMFRCLSRMQQILSSILPCILVTPGDYPDLARLLEEIGRTLQQLCIYRQTSYV